VDQFEEVYTYALSLEQTDGDAFIAERDAFIENLLCAAAEPTKRVSVILTLRSDFLGDTQQHPRLNKLFSTQGFLVPIMQPEELEIAIAKPAEQAGHKLDKAIVTLLVEQTQGREGHTPSTTVCPDPDLGGLARWGRSGRNLAQHWWSRRRTGG
jgi:hypothetical protein